jgi:hypothetical protein
MICMIIVHCSQPYKFLSDGSPTTTLAPHKIHNIKPDSRATTLTIPIHLESLQRGSHIRSPETKNARSLNRKAQIRIQDSKIHSRRSETQKKQHRTPSSPPAHQVADMWGQQLQAGIGPTCQLNPSGTMPSRINQN